MCDGRENSSQPFSIVRDISEPRSNFLNLESKVSCHWTVLEKNKHLFWKVSFLDSKYSSKMSINIRHSCSLAADSSAHPGCVQGLLPEVALLGSYETCKTWGLVGLVGLGGAWWGLVGPGRAWWTWWTWWTWWGLVGPGEPGGGLVGH